MRSRQLIHTTVTARSAFPELDKAGCEKRWQADISVAGTVQSAVEYINDWLAQKGMEATQHGQLVQIRKAKGREGPGIVAVENARWIWVEKRQ